MYIQVMIIDSDLDSAKQLKYALQNDTTRAYYTTSVTEGIKHLVRFHYQLVIMDVSQGEGDGFQPLRKVRQFTAIPILAVSTNGEIDHIVQALAVADDYLKKPVERNVCAVKMQALLRRNARTEVPLDAPLILSDDNKLLIDPGRRKVVLMDVAITLP